MTLADPHSLKSALSRLAQQGYQPVDAEHLDALALQSPMLVVMLNEDPLKYPEVLDNLVIVPQVLREFASGTFQVAYADQVHSRRIAQRFGIVKYPALLFLRQGEYVGVITGLMNWPDIVQAFADKLTAATSRAPSVGIAVTVAANPGDAA